MRINMKKHMSRLLSGVTNEENFHTKSVKFFGTMTTNIAREEHTESRKDNYKRVK